LYRKALGPVYLKKLFRETLRTMKTQAVLTGTVLFIETVLLQIFRHIFRSGDWESVHGKDELFVKIHSKANYYTQSRAILCNRSIEGDDWSCD